MPKVNLATWNATTKDEFIEDYRYYIKYKTVMYGSNVWVCPYSRFVAEYPRWCPVWKIDLDAMRYGKVVLPQYN